MEVFKGKSLTIQWLAIPFVAAFFTMPISVHYFGFISPASVLFNLVFVPFFSFVVMPLGFLGMLAANIWGDGAQYLFKLCCDAISLILLSGEKLGMLKAVPKPGAAYFYLFYLSVIIAIFARRSVLKHILLGISAFALIIIPIVLQHQRMSQGIIFDFISVGQGDCILITKGRNAILIDAGGSMTGFDTGRFVVGPRLLSRGITKLDLVIATHSHPDHAGGLPFILKMFKTSQVWINCKNDLGFQDVLEITKMKRIPVKEVSFSDSIKFPNGLKLLVLHPWHKLDCSEKKMDLNLHSIILAGGDENLKGMFMADSDMFGEVNMAHLNMDIKADILKVAHHGSKKSCQDIFIEAINPIAAVIMCGRNNPFSLPSQEAVSSLNARNVDVLMTSVNGEILISGDKETIRIKSFRNSAEKNLRRVKYSLSGGSK
jgi:competence protein ComEC